MPTHSSRISAAFNHRDRFPKNGLPNFLASMRAAKSEFWYPPALYVQLHGLLPLFLVASDITFRFLHNGAEEDINRAAEFGKAAHETSGIEELWIRPLHLRQYVLTPKD
jgi:hypothetical protein